MPSVHCGVNYDSSRELVHYLAELEIIPAAEIVVIMKAPFDGQGCGQPGRRSCARYSLRLLIHRTSILFRE